MVSGKTACPVCKLADSITYSEWTENQSPLGSGENWPMLMTDLTQVCECTLTPEQQSEAIEAILADLSAQELLDAGEWADELWNAREGTIDGAMFS